MNWWLELLKVVITAALTSLAVTWIQSHLGYLSQRRIEWERINKEQAAAVVEFLAIWFGVAYGKTLDDNATRLELQKRYFQLALFLDEQALRKLTKLVSNKADFDSRAVIVALRRQFMGERDGIQADHLSQWPPHEAEPANSCAECRNVENVHA